MNKYTFKSWYSDAEEWVELDVWADDFGEAFDLAYDRVYSTPGLSPDIEFVGLLTTGSMQIKDLWLKFGVCDTLD